MKKVLINSPHRKQCIPRRVKFIHDDQINFNNQKNVFRDLDGTSTSVNVFLKHLLMMTSRKDYTKQHINLQVIKWHVILEITYIVSNTIIFGYREFRMISISYLSTVNTLTSSFEYMKNGGLITA